MNLIIVFILLIAIASSLSSSEEESTHDEYGPKIKLLEIYNDYYERKDQMGQDYGFSVPDAAERECVKEKIKLSTNGEKLVKAYLGNFLIQISTVVCSRNNEEQFQTIDNSEKEFSAIDVNDVTKIFCLRRKIMELNGAEKEVNEECKEVNQVCQKRIDQVASEYEELKEIGIDECVNLNANQFILKLFETIVFKIEENYKAYKKARKDFFDGKINLINKMSECLINKFNN